jgi:hypothetical protein
MLSSLTNRTSGKISIEWSTITIVVSTRDFRWFQFRGDSRGYTYTEVQVNCHLIENQLGSSYRSCGNYFRWAALFLIGTSLISQQCALQPTKQDAALHEPTVHCISFILGRFKVDTISYHEILFVFTRYKIPYDASSHMTYDVIDISQTHLIHVKPVNLLWISPSSVVNSCIGMVVVGVLYRTRLSIQPGRYHFRYAVQQQIPNNVFTAAIICYQNGFR